MNMKTIEGFETDAVRSEVFTDGNNYFYHEVGLADNEHEIMQKFETLAEAEKIYFWVKGLLESNHVEIFENEE